MTIISSLAYMLDKGISDLKSANQYSRSIKTKELTISFCRLIRSKLLYTVFFFFPIFRSCMDHKAKKLFLFLFAMMLPWTE